MLMVQSDAGAHACIRKAEPQDMPKVYSCGYDAWNEGRSLEEHIAFCHTSKKYPKGTWYLLEAENELKSVLICYQNVFQLPVGIAGIGSVATAPQFRNKGYASYLINEVKNILSKESQIHGYLLYSEVNPSIYEKLGFVRLPSQYQKYDKSVAMICALNKSLQTILGPEFLVPDYF